MNNFVILFFIHVLVNCIILYFFDYLKNKINIYDIPDHNRKIHDKPTPLMGGWIFLFNMIIYFIITKESMLSLEVSIFICSLFFLFIGVVDDKKNLSSYFKFFWLIIALLIFFNFSENMIINEIRIYNYVINLQSEVVIYFSVLCILLFVNALNLFDGINLQSGLYALYLLLFLLHKGTFAEIIFVLIISLLLIIYLNSKNKIFMGDGGTLFLGCIISLIIIANYNEGKTLEVDEIFLLMILPGVDMLRLFLQRIFSGQNPFVGDRQHLHHYLLGHYGYKFSIFFITVLSIMPSLLNFFISSKLIIVIFLIFYLVVLIFVKKKNYKTS